MGKWTPEYKREYQREYRAKNKERIAAQLKEYRSTPEAKSRAAELKRERRRLDPAKLARDREILRNWYRRNRKAVLAKQKADRDANPERYRAKRIRMQYGLTLEQLAQMRRNQNNACAICGAELLDDGIRGMHIDHCHTTGKVRGLLCSSCNCGLGMFRDRPDLMESAAEYLRRTSLPPPAL